MVGHGVKNDSDWRVNNGFLAEAKNRLGYDSAPSRNGLTGSRNVLSTIRLPGHRRMADPNRTVSLLASMLAGYEQE
jgi:hypothetical protein